jgi:ankyrin repeat protein
MKVLDRILQTALLLLAAGTAQGQAQSTNLQSAIVKIQTDGGDGQATGFIFVIDTHNKTVWIMTAYHVVKAGSEFKVSFASPNGFAAGSYVSATVQQSTKDIGESNGLAILSTKQKEYDNIPSDIRFLTFRNPAATKPPEISTEYLQFGYPTEVSLTSRRPDRVILETRANRSYRWKAEPVLDFGYSGGPLLFAGHVLGLCQSSDSNGLFENYTPVEALQDIISAYNHDHPNAMIPDEGKDVETQVNKAVNILDGKPTAPPTTLEECESSIATIIKKCATHEVMLPVSRKTTLMAAAQLGFAGIIDLLKGHSDVNELYQPNTPDAKDNNKDYNKFPLYFCAESKSSHCYETVKALLDYGNLNVSAKFKLETALMRAVACKNSAFVKGLFESFDRRNITEDGYDPFYPSGNPDKSAIGQAVNGLKSATDDSYVNIVLEFARVASNLDLNVNGRRRFFIKALANLRTKQGDYNKSREQIARALLGSDIDSSFLSTAVMNSDTESVEEYFEANIGSDQPTNLHGLLLKALTAQNNTRIAELLIAHGACARKDTISVGGKNALHLLVSRTNQQNLLQALLAASFKVDRNATLEAIDAEQDDGQSPLMIAVANKDVEVARVLLNSQANTNVANKMTGQTALIEAISLGAPSDLVNLLLSKMNDVNARDKKQKTALAYAVELRNCPAVEALMGKGAQDSAINYERLDDVDVRKCYVTGLLKQKGYSIDKVGFSQAVDRGKAEDIKEFVLAGIINERSPVAEGKAVLVAIGANDLKLFKLLLGSASDGNVQDEHGKTILMVAVQMQREEMVEDLLSRPGINVTARDADHLDVVDYAGKTSPRDATYQQRMARNVLVKLGFPFDSRLPLSSDQRHSLYNKLGNYIKKDVEQLPRWFDIADITFTKSEGGPASKVRLLMFAAKDGEGEIVRAFARYKPDAQDSRGYTALMYAINQDDPTTILKMVRTLVVDFGAKARIKGFDGETAIKFVDGNLHLRRTPDIQRVIKRLLQK